MTTTIARTLAEPSAHPLTLAWQAIAHRWAAHLEAQRRLREAEALCHLNADTLRDIGAPERWVERAVAMREAEKLRLLQLRQWRSG